MQQASVPVLLLPVSHLTPSTALAAIYPFKQRGLPISLERETMDCKQLQWKPKSATISTASLGMGTATTGSAATV
jgi:hypothetical protein